MFKVVELGFVILLSSFRCCLPQIVDYSDGFNLTEPEFVPRVVNGYPARLEEVPYQLAFKNMMNRGMQYYGTFCGGAIIGPTKVLTAAHCFESNSNKWTRWCGGSKVDKKQLARTFAVAGVLENYAKYGVHGQWRKIKTMHMPKKYKFPKDDIAVGYTTRPFVFNSVVASIPYDRYFHNYYGTCIASGYGRTSPKTHSSMLLKAELRVLTTSKCNKLHRRNMAKFVCTSAAYSDVHKGDSGGPLVCAMDNDPSGPRGLLVGVVSGNRNRAGTFFTRVSSYVRFIENRSSGCADCDNFLMILCILYSGILLF